jgi:hypothetical protein
LATRESVVKLLSAFGSGSSAIARVERSSVASSAIFDAERRIAALSLSPFTRELCRGSVSRRACARFRERGSMLQILMRASVVAAIPVALSGCYVVPVNPDGSAGYAAVVPAPVAVVGAPVPVALQARLYPANDIATRTGMLGGTVTNMMNGRGRFRLDYGGEILVGEATRASKDDRSGVANAYGPSGTYMTCSYTMSTPYQGAGTCKLSNGAQYQVHLGS